MFGANRRSAINVDEGSILPFFERPDSTASFLGLLQALRHYCYLCGR